jgi:urea transport system permease protein
VLSLLNNRPLDTILATWGVGIMLQQGVRLMVGSELRYVQLPPSLADSMDVFGLSVSSYRVFLFTVTIALFAVTWILMNHTTIGMKLRAIMQDRSVAASFGINAKRVYGLTFAYGAGLAGLAGALVSPLKSVSPDMGTGYVIDAFMVVVLGGVQSLAGTVASAFILGELSGAIAFLQNDTVAKALVLLAIVVLIRFRPEGYSQRACAPETRLQVYAIEDVVPNWIVAARSAARADPHCLCNRVRAAAGPQ